MKIIFKIFVVIMLVSYGQNQCVAQDHVGNRTDGKAFISVHSGAYIPSISSFNKVYHSPCAFINGISLGFPFTNEDFFFYLKGMYFQKSGTPITHHFEYDNQTGEFTTYTTQEDDVTVIWHQFLVNIGIQYNFKFDLTNNLLFNGGITLIKLSEKANDSSVSFDSGGFSPGYFFGIGYEKRILDKFSLFSEVQCNLDLPILKTLDIGSGGAGVNLNVGIRYYFNQK